MRFLFLTGLFFAGTALLAALLTRVALAILRRRAILDRPNERSSHSVPTPRGGGWGLMGALLPLWIWSTARAGRFGDPTEWLVLAGAVILMAVSWIDDRKGLGPGPRFGAQLLMASLVAISLPAGLSLTSGHLPLVLDRILAVLAWLWFVNLFNFMDGVDGIAGGSAACMGLGLMLVWRLHGPSELDAFRGAMIAAASVGFLWWNWHPAKVFMGDVGSIPLGFLLGYELLRLAMDQGQIFALIIAGYYLADATITLLRRGLRGERVWRAHREHFYQRAVQSGRSHAQVSRAAIRTQLGLAALAVLAARFTPWMAVPAALLVLGLLFWMSRRPRPA